MSEYIITNEQLNWFLERMDETDVIPSAIVLTHLNPIVRCKDCKHFTPKGTHKFENGKVNADYCDYVRGWMLQITPDGFCAWVEEDDFVTCKCGEDIERHDRIKTCPIVRE